MTELLTARETADRFRLKSSETVLRWWRQGKLPGCKLPSGAVRFREDAVERCLEEWATPRRGVLTATPGAARSDRVVSTVLTATDDEEDHHAP